LLRFIQKPPDIAIEIFSLAYDSNAHPVAVKVGEIVPNESAQQRHKVTDLRRRPRPVFGTEGENGQKPDAEISRCAHGSAERLDTAPMSLAPW
jgi:hypothetical protein